MKDEKSLNEKLIIIQSELKAPKNQFNKFANFKYRSCEDILEAVKPLLEKQGLALILYDEMVLIGDRFYIKAVASLGNGIDSRLSWAFAREPLSKKGMDESQITGAASSYARKYALNGLFCIDDNRDADHSNNQDIKEPKKELSAPKKKMPLNKPSEPLNKPKEASSTKSANKEEKPLKTNPKPKNDENKTINQKLKDLREKLGDEDFNYILKKNKYKSVRDIKSVIKVKEIIIAMESVLNAKNETEGTVENA